MTTEMKREEIEGHLYQSGNGQLLIDAHASDEEHLTAQATHFEQPMYRCRQYIRDLVPKEWLNKRGTFIIDRTVTSTGEVIAVQIGFVPKS